MDSYVKVGTIHGRYGERDVVVLCNNGEEREYESTFTGAMGDMVKAHREHIEKLQRLLNGR